MGASRTTMLTLRAMRARAGISQKKLAAQAGVPSSLIAEAETGKSTLSPDVAMKSAQVLGVDGVMLMIDHNTATIRSRIEAGEEGPVRALRLAKTLVQMLEDGSLDRSQSKAARGAVSELLALVNEHMPPESAAHYEEDTNLSLQRDTHGRPIKADEAEQRRESRDAGVWDALGSDDPGSRASAEVHRDLMDDLGRDSAGRPKPKRGAGLG